MTPPIGANFYIGYSFFFKSFLTFIQQVVLFFFTQWTQWHSITVYPQLSGVHLFSPRLPKLSLSDGSIGDREQREKIQ